MLRRLKNIIPAILLFAPYTALAQQNSSPNILNWFTDPAGSSLFFLTNFISSLGGKLIAFAAFLVNAAFAFTFNVVNSTVVTQGYQITLTLANLGFVIGIIIIAVATILRSQTYGIKRLLTSLIAMAILVNFGLIISGVLVNLSDQLTIYFMNSVTGGAQDPSLWVKAMTNSLAPQSLFFDSQTQGFWNRYADTANNTSNVPDTIQQLFSLVFVILFTYLFALALGVLGIMLFLRYFWLTFLFILLPLAWLSWVFPALKKHWSDWWQHFIKWTFFAPVLMFFMYLAVAVGTISNESYLQNTLAPVAKDSLTGELASNLNRQPAFLGALVKEVVVLGLIFGGLMAANKMGVGLAGAALNGAQSAGKWVWGGTKRGARRQIRKLSPAQETARKTGREWLNSNNYFKRVAGRGLLAYSRAGREKNVAEYKEEVGKMSTQKAVESLQTTVDADKKIALLEKIKNDGKLDQVKNLQQHLDEDVFKKTGNEKLYGEILNASGLRFVDAGKRRKDLEERAKAGGDDGKAAEDELKKMDKSLADAIKTGTPENLAKFFNAYDEKSPAYGLTSEEYNAAQKEVLKNLAKSGSPDKVRKLYVDTLNTDQVKQLQDIGREMADKGEFAASDVNEKLLKYLDNSKISFLDRTSFGLNPGAALSQKERENAEENINAT